MRQWSWIELRAFVALYLVAFGIGFMFAQTSDGRLMLGALFVTMGITFLVRFTLTLREK